MSAGARRRAAARSGRTGTAAARTRFRSAGRPSACRARSSSTLPGARAVAVRAAQRDRVDGGEPANRAAQVDVGFENRPARPVQVDGDGTVADRGRDRPAQRRQQDFLDRQPEAGGARRRSRLFPNAVNADDSLARSSAAGGSETSEPTSAGSLRYGRPARNRGSRPPRDAWPARRSAATTPATTW